MIEQFINTTYIYHLCYFIILGLLFPSNYIGALCLGVLWELIEECLTAKKVSNDIIIQHFNDYQNGNKTKLIGLSINMIGYYLGNKVRGFSPL